MTEEKKSQNLKLPKTEKRKDTGKIQWDNHCPNYAPIN